MGFKDKAAGKQLLTDEVIEAAKAELTNADKVVEETLGEVPVVVYFGLVLA